MKILVLFGLIATSLAASVSEPEATPHDEKAVVVAHHGAVVPNTYGAVHGVGHHTVYGAGFNAYHTGAVVPNTYGAVHGVGHHTVYGAGLNAYHTGAVVAQPTAAVTGAVVAAQPAAAVTYSGAPVVEVQHTQAVAVEAAPAISYQSAQAVAVQAIPSVSYQAAPAVAYQAAPAVAVQAAPAVAVQAAPVSHAITYQNVAHTVELPPKEVKVPVTTQHVEVPIHQKVHYGQQAYVAGSTTTIHKPSLAAPAIAPPSTLLSKVEHKAPEVSIQTQEIPVERHTPNFVETPYHAGTIVQYTEPEIKEVKVPTPVAQPVPVPHPVPVAAPYAVPEAVPVRQEIHSVNVHQPVVQHQVAHVAPAAATYAHGVAAQAVDVAQAFVPAVGAFTHGVAPAVGTTYAHGVNVAQAAVPTVGTVTHGVAPAVGTYAHGFASAINAVNHQFISDPAVTTYAHGVAPAVGSVTHGVAPAGTTYAHGIAPAFNAVNQHFISGIAPAAATVVKADD